MTYDVGNPGPGFGLAQICFHSKRPHTVIKMND